MSYGWQYWTFEKLHNQLMNAVQRCFVTIMRGWLNQFIWKTGNIRIKLIKMMKNSAVSVILPPMVWFFVVDPQVLGHTRSLESMNRSWNDKTHEFHGSFYTSKPHFITNIAKNRPLKIQANFVEMILMHDNNNFVKNVWLLFLFQG